jgi:Asp-tRNA(Asn)/Glu-tRNA(Gln) amidotransferase A subunit family amidase
MSADRAEGAPMSLGPLLGDLRAGRTTSVEVAERCLRAIDACEPRVKALLDEPDRRARLRREAKGIALRWPDPASRPALYGIPVGVKDLIRVDGLETRAGSDLPPKAFAGPQASIVTHLRSLGALVVGKTTTDEFAFQDPPPTRNPHDLTRSPGGSSAGSAAGVACGMFPLALGTQTARSLIAPAAWCGVVGFKPSHGRTPSDGVVALAPWFDVVGLLTADADGAALAAAALVDGFGSIPATPITMGVPVGAYLDQQPDDGWRQPFRSALSSLARAGIDVRDVRLDFDPAAVMRTAVVLLRGEMARVHGAWFSRWPDRYRASSRAGVLDGQAVGDAELVAARAEGLALRNRLAEAMDFAGIDVLASPAQPGPAAPLGQGTGRGTTTMPWSFAGLPCATIPFGTIGDLPFGFQLIGRFGADEVLAGAMRAVAHARDANP